MKKLLPLSLCAVCLFSGCTIRKGCNSPENPEFETEYAIEEHIEMLSTRTEKRFTEEIANGEIISYSIDILYAIYDDAPEYFLVELEYAKEWEGRYRNPNHEENQTDEYITYKTKNKHLIGFIQNDEYYIGLDLYCKKGKDFYNCEKDIPTDGFLDGKSAYRLYGHEQSKKYYAMGEQAVERDSELIVLFSSDDMRLSDGTSPEFHVHQDKQDRCAYGEKISKGTRDTKKEIRNRDIY